MENSVLRHQHSSLAVTDKGTPVTATTTINVLKNSILWLLTDGS